MLGFDRADRTLVNLRVNLCGPKLSQMAEIDPNLGEFGCEDNCNTRCLVLCVLFEVLAKLASGNLRDA